MVSQAVLGSWHSRWAKYVYTLSRIVQGMGWNEARRSLDVRGLKARLGDSASLYRDPLVV